jgi:hypothetical protein
MYTLTILMHCLASESNAHQKCGKCTQIIVHWWINAIPIPHIDLGYAMQGPTLPNQCNVMCYWYMHCISYTVSVKLYSQWKFTFTACNSSFTEASKPTESHFLTQYKSSNQNIIYNPSQLKIARFTILFFACHTCYFFLACTLLTYIFQNLLIISEQNFKLLH